MFLKIDVLKIIQYSQEKAVLESPLNELSGKTSIFFVEHLRWLLLLTVKLYYKLLLYKEYFYKQHQAEIGKNSSKS